MVRVLHLHPTVSDFQTRNSVEQIIATANDDFAFEEQAVGRGGDYPNWLAAVIPLRALRKKFDRVHAWGLNELAAAALAGFERIIFSPPVGVRASGFDWLKRILRHRSVPMVFASRSQRNAFSLNGIPADSFPVIYPGIQPLPVGRDGALRKKLGFSDSEFVLLAVGESTRATSHRDAVWATGILNVLDKRYRLLTWGCGPEPQALARFAGRLRQSGMLVQAQMRLGRSVEFQELTRVADAAIVSARGPIPTLPIMVCMAAGLPIISSATPTVREILEDNRTALLVEEATARRLSQRVLDLAGDGALRERMIQSARADLISRFSEGRFLECWGDVYRQVTPAGAVNPREWALRSV